MIGISDITHVHVLLSYQQSCSLSHSQLHQVPPHRADGPHRFVFKYTFILLNWLHLIFVFILLMIIDHLSSASVASSSWVLDLHVC